MLRNYVAFVGCARENSSKVRFQFLVHEGCRRLFSVKAKKKSQHVCKELKYERVYR